MYVIEAFIFRWLVTYFSTNKKARCKETYFLPTLRTRCKNIRRKDINSIQIQNICVVNRSFRKSVISILEDPVSNVVQDTGCPDWKYTRTRRRPRLSIRVQGTFVETLFRNDDRKNQFGRGINLLTPNDDYSGRTAPLTSKCCILYIYSTNIVTKYFKHGIYSAFFSLQNAVCFINLTYLVPVLFTFYIQYVLKLKK